MLELEDVEVDTNWGWDPRIRKVGKHYRKLNGEQYISPRIILSSNFNDLIGKEFRTYIAKLKIRERYWNRELELKGKAIILFFPENQKEIEFEEGF